MVICILVLLVGIASDYYSRTVVPRPMERVTIQDGLPKRELTLVPKPEAIITAILGTFCYTLSASIFIIVFIENRINADWGEKLEKLRQDINRNVFDALFGVFVPEEILKTIKKDIINNQTVRKNTRWELNFVEIDNDLKLIQTIEYEIENVSARSAKNFLKTKLQKFAKNEYSCLRKASVKVNREEVCYYEKDNRQNGIRVCEEDNTPSSIEYLLELPPNWTADVVNIFETTYYNGRTNGAIDFLGTIYPTINIVLEVIYPHDNYEFELFPLLSYSLDEQPTRDGELKYSINGGILPYQGVIFSITPSTN